MTGTLSAAVIRTRRQQRFPYLGGNCLPTGTSVEEMMGHFELQRDQEFSSHVCADHPTNTSAKLYRLRQ
jgi:hypothetical protein